MNIFGFFWMLWWYHWVICLISRQDNSHGIAHNLTWWSPDLISGIVLNYSWVENNDKKRNEISLKQDILHRAYASLKSWYTNDMLPIWSTSEEKKTVRNYLIISLQQGERCTTLTLHHILASIFSLTITIRATTKTTKMTSTGTAAWILRGSSI